jgi:hypothetical protein
MGFVIWKSTTICLVISGRLPALIAAINHNLVLAICDGLGHEPQRAVRVGDLHAGDRTGRTHLNGQSERRLRDSPAGLRG